MGAYEVVDLFSGAGGMSAGFAAHPAFRVVGAADAQLGKPSSPRGSIGCNRTYEANIGVAPVDADLGKADPDDVLAAMGLPRTPDVLLACPPCTGFSRALAVNHTRDDSRNGLVRRVARYVAAIEPQVVVMENARELAMGNYAGHLAALTRDLRGLGYRVSAQVHLLDAYGLPQRRERAVVIASRGDLRTLPDLWDGLELDPKATHVRRAIWGMPPLGAGWRDDTDPAHVAPSLNERSRERLAAIPHDGGGWTDLVGVRDDLLTPSMRDRVARNRLGSHPDVYGRLAWDRPAATVKRECGHVGNGRYAHPEQDRLCSVRELALLQGFPASYEFTGSLANMYRQVGDAVPPLVSHQLAHAVAWMLDGVRPSPESLVLDGTSLTPADITPA